MRPSGPVMAKVLKFYQAFPRHCPLGPVIDRKVVKIRPRRHCPEKRSAPTCQQTVPLGPVMARKCENIAPSMLDPAGSTLLTRVFGLESACR